MLIQCISQHVKRTKENRCTAGTYFMHQYLILVVSGLVTECKYSINLHYNLSSVIIYMYIEGYFNVLLLV